jgi:hypothetical protein
MIKFKEFVIPTSIGFGLVGFVLLTIKYIPLVVLSICGLLGSWLIGKMVLDIIDCYKESKF